MDKVFGGDLFAGAGGFSEGFRRACEKRGLPLESFAVNHWDKAIAVHTLNHPYATHRCEDVQVVRPRELVPGGHLHLLLAAPSCVHHSNARGGKPVNEQDRASAWCVTRWLTEIEVDTLILENVPEFRTWGPVDPKTGRPVKAEKGRYFNAFVNTLRELGYSVEYRVLCCADYGDPTTRRRLFLIAVKHGCPKWPEQTHCDPRMIAKDSFGLFDHLKPWIPARKIIDWSIKSQSVFLRKKRLATKTLERTVAGFQKFGGPNAGPWIHALRYYIDHGTFDAVFRLDWDGAIDAAPAPIIIGRGGPEGAGKPISVDGPFGTVLTVNHKAVAEPVLLGYRGGEPAKSNRSHSLDDPLPTQDTSNRYAVADPVMVTLRNHMEGGSVEDPVPTICASGQHQAVAEPIVVNLKGQSDATGIDAPLPTQTAHASHLYTAEAFILPHWKFDSDGSDSLDVPLRTVDATNGRQFKVVEPVIIPNFGEREGQQPRAHSLEEPLPTVTSHGAGALAEPIMLNIDNQGGHGNQTRSVDSPISTQTTKARTAIAEPIIAQYNGTAECRSIEDPLGTATTKDRFALAEAFADFEGYVPGLPVFILPDGAWFQIDVHLRMLKKHELAAAHSIPDYKFLGTMEDGVKMIGNMVPVSMAEALCGAELDRRLAESLVEAAA